MTEDDVRAAAERLVQFHERFAPCSAGIRPRITPTPMSRG
jgi:hypothetical protein